MAFGSKERHYPKILELRPRTEGDLSQLAMERLLLARTALLDTKVGLDRPQLVSSAHGDIERMLLTIPSYAVLDIEGTPNPVAQTYMDLLSKLDSSTSFEVLTHEAVQEEVAGWFAEAGLDSVHIIAVPDHLHFSIWAEDGYAVAQTDGTGSPSFVEPFQFPRYADGLIADFVSNDTDIGHTQAPLYFQGGNILIGDDFFLLGADYPAKSLAYIGKAIIPGQGEAPAKTVRRLYREYLDDDRQLHYVGSSIPVPHEQVRTITVNGQEWEEWLYFGNAEGTVQPLFHIDMFITLAGRDSAGRYQVVVGDPKAAARILGVPVWPHAMQEVFDNIARSLAHSGFAVHRSPLPLAYVDDAKDKIRTWYFATANNALVAVDGDTKRIWLPTYGYGDWEELAKTDSANRDLWQSLGFEVTMLGDFHPFAENLGAVHCIKKYLSRRENGTTPTVVDEGS